MNSVHTTAYRVTIFMDFNDTTIYTLSMVHVLIALKFNLILKHTFF